MTEEEAKAWLVESLAVSRETLGQLDAFREMVIAENARQNLISAGSIPYFWGRHIVDSAQLLGFSQAKGLATTPDYPEPVEGLPFLAASNRLGFDKLSQTVGGDPANEAHPSWLDLGTGAGFPGMIVAILRDSPITFVESRRRRVEFLREAADQLRLDHVSVELCQLESLRGGPFDVISARAFAPLPRLFALAHRFSTAKTIWLLPKGRSAHSELESIAESWQGLFHVKHSVTDPESAIIVASQVSPRAR